MIKKDKKEKKIKEKKKLTITQMLLPIFAIIVIFESIALVFLLITVNGKKSFISGKEWDSTYTYNKTKYKVYFKFDKGNKFEYGVYNNGELDMNSKLEGKYTVVNDKIIIEYTANDEELSSIIYIGKDYLCAAEKKCSDVTKYYKSTDKRTEIYDNFGDEDDYDDTEEDDTDNSYLNNKPEYKQVSEPTIYIFHGDGCPHCADLLDWIKGYKYKKSFKIVKYEVWNNRDNQVLMSKVSKYLDSEAGGVPFIVIGDETIVGFAESSTPSEITKALDKAYSNIDKNKYYDVIETVKK